MDQCIAEIICHESGDVQYIVNSGSNIKALQRLGHVYKGRKMTIKMDTKKDYVNWLVKWGHVNNQRSPKEQISFGTDGLDAI